jgi:SAM-dependent methyltransferase
VRLHGMGKRKTIQKIKDCVTFPLRAMTLFYDDRWGLSSLATERYDYVSKEVIGYCLDVGCGRYNRFINEFRDENGKGIDIFPYDGLLPDNIVEDISCFPFKDDTFDSVTFIANLNHIPLHLRDRELSEAYRVLKAHGNVIVTMGNPIAEIFAHKAIALYDKIYGTSYDIDAERGMQENEEYYVRDSEIIMRLNRAGFGNIRKKLFGTQWFLNHLFVAWKTDERLI